MNATINRTTQKADPEKGSNGSSQLGKTRVLTVLGLGLDNNEATCRVFV